MPNYWKYNKSMIDFFPTEHISSSCKRKFGICDRPARLPKKHTSLKNRDRIGLRQWTITTGLKVNFVPVDHCIELRKADGKMDNRCDGCLFYEDTIIFVELKQRKAKGTNGIKDEQQLRATTLDFLKNKKRHRNPPFIKNA